MGLHGTFWQRGGNWGGFCETLPEASPMSKRANATGSGVDLLLAEAEPSSDGGSALGEQS